MKNKILYTTGLACALTLLISGNTAKATDCFGNAGYCLTDGNIQFQINSLAEMEIYVNGVQHVWTTDFVVAEITGDPATTPYPLSMYDYIDFNQDPGGTYSTLTLSNMPLSSWGTVDITFQVIGGAVADSATIIQDFTITNNSSVAQLVNLFAYTDVDVGGTFSYTDDWGELVGFDANGYPTAYRQFDDTHELITSLNIRPNYYQVSIGNECRQDLCEKIFLGVNIILPNTVTPYQGNLEQAGEYVRNLQPGESFSYTQTMALSALNTNTIGDADFDKDGLADDLDADPFNVFIPNAEGINLSHSPNFDDPLADDTAFLNSETLRFLTWSNVVGAGAATSYTLTGGETSLSGSLTYLGNGTYSAEISLADLNYIGNDVVLEVALKRKKFKYNVTKTINVIFDTNTPPVVSVSVPDDGSNYPSATSVNFTCTASDAEDGNIAPSCTWTSNRDGNLGVGSSISAILSDGFHIITATITDSNNRVASDSIEISMGTPLVLTTTAYKIKGKQVVDLAWSNANSSQVEIYRDGLVIARASNTGTYTDNIGTKGSATYFYVVCESGTTNCSKNTSVSF